MHREYLTGTITTVKSGKDHSSLRLLDNQRNGHKMTINGYVPKHLAGARIDYHERTLDNKTYQIIESEFLDETRSRTNTYIYRKDGSNWRMRVLYDTGLAQKARQFWTKTKKSSLGKAAKDTKQLAEELTDRLE